jgi:uncharacterized protein YceH (UPF0502 family)
VRLAREPGRRDSRYAHLFSGPVEGDREERHAETHSSTTTPETAFPDMRQEERLERLEDEVRALRAELNELKARLGD